VSGGRSANGNGFDYRLQKALLLVDRDGLIDDRTAVNAFPGIEDQEEVRESLQRHEPFAPSACHDVLPV
jgi:hypothetical protein